MSPLLKSTYDMRGGQMPATVGKEATVPVRLSFIADTAAVAGREGQMDCADD